MDLTGDLVSHAELLARLTPDERGSVERGEALVCSHPLAGQHGPCVLGAVMLAAEREHAWQLFLDWERVGDFVPAVQYRTIERRVDGSSQHVTLHGQARVVLLRLHFTVNALFDAERFVQRWSLAPDAQVVALARTHHWLRGNSDLIRAIQGRTSFSVQGGRTLFVYENQLSTSALLPRAAEQFLSRRSIHAFLTAVADYFAAQPAQQPARQTPRDAPSSRV